MAPHIGTRAARWASGDNTHPLDDSAEVRLVEAELETTDPICRAAQSPELLLQLGVIARAVVLEEVRGFWCIQPFPRLACNARSLQCRAEQCTSRPLAEPDGVREPGFHLLLLIVPHGCVPLPRDSSLVGAIRASQRAAGIFFALAQS